MMHYRIFFQLQNRCQILLWRSLLRKVFQLYGTRPAPESRIAATLELDKGVDAFTAVQPPADQYIDPDLEGADDLSNDYQTFDITALESKLSSLIDQGLVSGYVSHERRKLAILGGSKTGDHVKAGFPNVWQVLSNKQGDDVPGWKKDVSSTAAPTPFAGAGPGMVFKFSSLKPIGAAG